MASYPRKTDVVPVVVRLVGAGDSLPAIAEAEFQQVDDLEFDGRRARSGPASGVVGVPRGPTAGHPDGCGASSPDRRVAEPGEFAAQQRVGPLAALVRIDSGLVRTRDNLRKFLRPAFEYAAFTTTRLPIAVANFFSERPFFTVSRPQSAKTFRTAAGSDVPTTTDSMPTNSPFGRSPPYSLSGSRVALHDLLVPCTM